jgi:hypothetical protein
VNLDVEVRYEKKGLHEEGGTLLEAIENSRATASEQ